MAVAHFAFAGQHSLYLLPSCRQDNLLLCLLLNLHLLDSIACILCLPAVMGSFVCLLPTLHLPHSTAYTLSASTAG